MSPPCMAAIFEGDNGGATHTGVSATEIRVAVPALGPSATDAMNRTIDALFEHFNQRFEFYGRRLVPVYVNGSASTVLGARALAVDAASRGVFAAATGIAEWWSGQATLPAELAREGLVTIVRNGSTWWTDRALFDPLHPYVWSVFPSSEDIQANLGAFACSTLREGRAVHAGDPDLRTLPRKFGIVVGAVRSPAATSVLSSTLADCTGETPTRVELLTSGTTAAIDAALTRLKSAGVTTVICVCEEYSQWTAVPAAHRVGFHPEWILTPGYAGTGNDEWDTQQARAQGQLAPPMRMSAGPRLLPMQARPWFPIVATILNSDPTNIWRFGTPEFMYAQLLVLASGIQAAGPQLTPETFAAGLMSTEFPNPGAGAAPYWQPSAGFGPGDHSFYDDYQVGWWSDQAEALDVGFSSYAQGSWCYLDHGTRFRPGTYPTNGDARMFNPNVACR